MRDANILPKRHGFIRVFTCHVIFLLAVACSSAQSQTKRFDFVSQLGVGELKSGAEPCLTIKNAKLPTGSMVHLVLLEESQTVLQAQVVKKLTESCSKDPTTGNDDSFYSLRLSGPSPEVYELAIAIVNPVASLKVANGLVGSDLDGDGQREFFRECASNEGLHLTVWSGRPLKGKRRWHRYFYLGYDVEFNCTEKDFEE